MAEYTEPVADKPPDRNEELGPVPSLAGCAGVARYRGRGGRGHYRRQGMVLHGKLRALGHSRQHRTASDHAVGSRQSFPRRTDSGTSIG